MQFSAAPPLGLNVWKLKQRGAKRWGFI